MSVDARVRKLTQRALDELRASPDTLLALADRIGKILRHEELLQSVASRVADLVEDHVLWSDLARPDKPDHPVLTMLREHRDQLVEHVDHVLSAN